MKNIGRFAAFNILNSLYTLLQSSWLQYTLPQRPPKDPTLSGISQVRGINSSRQLLSGLPSDCRPFRIYIAQPAQSLLLYDFWTQTNRPQSSSIHSLYEFLIHFYRSHSWNFVRKFKHSRPRDLGSCCSSFLLSTPIFFFFFWVSKRWGHCLNFSPYLWKCGVVYSRHFHFYLNFFAFLFYHDPWYFYFFMYFRERSSTRTTF